MLRYDVARGWREVLADGKEIPVAVPDGRLAAGAEVPCAVAAFIDLVEKSNKFKPVVVDVLKMMSRQAAAAAPAPPPAPETPLKTGDIVWVAASVPEGVTGHLSDVDSANLGKIRIPGGFTVENLVDLYHAGHGLSDGAHMMYVAPGALVDTAWPEFKFLGGARRHVVKVRKLRGVESRGFFVPVPRGWNVKAGDNIWTRLRAARELAHGVVPAPVAEVKPKLPRVRKKDFRLRFSREADGVVSVRMQRTMHGGWVTVCRYGYKPEPKK